MWSLQGAIPVKWLLKSSLTDRRTNLMLSGQVASTAFLETSGLRNWLLESAVMAPEIWAPWESRKWAIVHGWVPKLLVQV